MVPRANALQDQVSFHFVSRHVMHICACLSKPIKILLVSHAQFINVLFCVVFRAFSNRQDACSFFAFYSLKDVLKSCEPAGVLVRIEFVRACRCTDMCYCRVSLSVYWYVLTSTLQGVHVPFSSLSKFLSVSIPAPEQHFYPSSMSFGVCTSSCIYSFIQAWCSSCLNPAFP